MELHQVCSQQGGHGYCTLWPFDHSLCHWGMSMAHCCYFYFLLRWDSYSRTLLTHPCHVFNQLSYSWRTPLLLFYSPIFWLLQLFVYSSFFFHFYFYYRKTSRKHLGYKAHVLLSTVIRSVNDVQQHYKREHLMDLFILCFIISFMFEFPWGS